MEDRINKLEDFTYDVLAKGGKKSIQLKDGTKFFASAQSNILCIRVNGGEPRHVFRNDKQLCEKIRNIISTELAHD